jgi:hypothetical protein
MNALLILALAVAASAEPQYWGGYAKPLVHQTYAHQAYAAYPYQSYAAPHMSYAATPMVHQTAFVKPVVHHVKPVVYSAPIVAPVHLPKYNAVSPGVQHIVAKREAEAEAKPDHHYGHATLPYTTGYQGVPYTTGFAGYSHVAPIATAYNQYYPYTHGIKAGTYANDAVSPFNYAAKGRYYANSAGTVHVAKREAEAEAKPYNMYSNYAGYSHVAPSAYSHVAPTAYSHVAPVHASAYSHVAPVAFNQYYPSVYGIKTPTYSNDAVSPFAYANKGQYYANSAGTVHIAKREAEAEAEAYHGYNSYYPRTYGGYGNVYGNGYTGYNGGYTGYNGYNAFNGYRSRYNY